MNGSQCISNWWRSHDEGFDQNLNEIGDLEPIHWVKMFFQKIFDVLDQFVFQHYLNSPVYFPIIVK